MKLKRIAKIDNFSIFKNFDWVTNLSYERNRVAQVYDFKKINIFYGRNYSGKTSLSKIIRSLEKKSLPPKYENPSFRIDFEDGSSINENNLHAFNHPIHVFNSDFVKENLKFISNDNENIQSFSVTLGGDNQQILDRIEELKSELGSNNKNLETKLYLKIKNHKNLIAEARKELAKKEKYLEDTLSNKATKKSDSIKNQYLYFGEINYTIAKLKSEIKIVQSNNLQALSSSELENYKALITQKKLPDPPKLSNSNTNFDTIISTIENIVKKTVGSSEKITELVENSSLNTWVQLGYNLHKNRKNCAFCDNLITEDRELELRRHFDEDTEKLQSRISKGIIHLDGLLEENIFKNQINIKDYYDQYHVELVELNNKLKAALNVRKCSIVQLKKLLEEKNKRLFTELEVGDIINNSEELDKIYSRLEKIREACIKLNNDFDSQKGDAQRLLRLNEIYNFIQQIDIEKLQTEIKDYSEKIRLLEDDLYALNQKVLSITCEIEVEQQKLQNESEACRQINNILNHDFGNQHLTLEAVEIDTVFGKTFNFEIKRTINNRKIKAYNLSEGECSLIAFCYFLAKVKDSLDKGDQPIIWIDDPICSLDSNHIYFIFSLIEDYICKEKKYSQLFISTHNLEFLKYLRRINGAQEDKSIISVKEEKRKASYFLIQRHDHFSSIREMPIYLSKFLTEFNFLFDQIYKCATVTTIDDSNFHLFYNFGNNARKFLEIYTFYKFPASSYQLDSQLESFWGEQIYKTLTDRIHNEYSHMTGVLERGGTVAEQPEMQKSARAIIRKIQEQDLLQYNALLESINMEISQDSLYPDPAA